MSTVTVRDISDETHAALVARAESQGKSLQAFLKSILEKEARKVDMEQLLDRVEKRVRAGGPHLTVDQIIAYKEADKR